MKPNWLFTISLAGFLCGILLTHTSEAAPKVVQTDNTQALLNDMRLRVNSLRHEIENHENEIRIFENKLRNQDDTVEALRAQVGSASQSHKEVIKSGIGQIENRLLPLEANQKGFVADLKTIKDHANETSAGLNQLSQRLSKLENAVDQQNQNIASLQEAMQSMLDALQMKDAPAVKRPVGVGDNSSGKTYKVKNGDSLGTIARDNHTTIQAIKDLNQLKNDRIVIGQTLKLP